MPLFMRHRLAISGLGRLARLVFAAVVFLVGGLVWGQPGDVAYAAGARVSECHRTRSTTNPYRLITISNSGVNSHRNNHTGGVWDVTKINGGTWGDIVPGGSTDADAGQFWSTGNAGPNSLNWDLFGKPFMLPSGANLSKCGRMTALRFYEISKAAGDSDATIAADLQDQEANEDAAIKPVGGWTAANLVTSIGAVSITSNNPSVVGSTTASLSGTIVAGTTSTTPRFEYGTTMSLGTTVSGGSAATGTINATASLTGLSTNTTYYFRVIGEIGNTDTLGTYYGDILSFTTGKISRTVTVAAVSTTLINSATTILSTTISASTVGTTTYTVVTGILYCSITGVTLTADATSTGTCTVRGEDAGNSTYNPAISATISIAVQALISRTLTLSGDSGPYGFSATPPTMAATASAADGLGAKSFSSSTTGVCTVNSSTGVVAFVDAGTCTIGAEITAGGGYVSVTAASRSFSITATTRTLTLSGDSGPYGFSATPPTMTATPSAGVGSGTKSFSSSTTGVCTVNSSTGVVAFVDAGTCTIGAEITAGGGYVSVTAASRSFSITATTRTLTLSGDSGPYGISATPPTMTATPSAGVGSGTKSFSSSTTGVCTVNSSTGVVAFVDAGTCTIGSEITAGGGYVSVTAASRSFSVTATSRTLTLSGDSGPYVFTATPPTMTATPSANVSGTKSFSSSTTGVCTVNSSTGVVAFVDAGTCTIGSEITAGGGYASASAASRSFSVTATTRTLTLSGDSGPYGFSATPPTMTATASAANVSGTKSFSSSTTGVCTVNSSTGVVTFVSAGTCTIGSEITAGGGYVSVTATSRSFSVTATSRTLTLSGDSGPYGISATPPTMTATPSAGVGSGTKSFSSSTTGVCTVNSSTGVVAFVDAGTCTIGSEITPGGGFASASAASRSFSVTAASTTTTVPSTTTSTTTSTVPSTAKTTITTTTTTTTATTTVSKPKKNTKRTLLLLGSNSSYGFSSKPPTMAATASDGVGSGTKSFSSSTTSVCTVNSNTGVVTFVTAGTCTIGAEITAGGVFSSASSGTRSFTVNVEPISATTSSTSTSTTTKPNMTTTSTTVSISRSNPSTTAPAINTVDVGSGPVPSFSVVPSSDEGSTATTQVLSTGSGSNAKRSIEQLRTEKMKGFEPGSGVSVDVIGTRTIGQFAILPTGTADNIAIASALLESTDRTATDFARIKEAKAVQEPSAEILKTTNKVESTDAEMFQKFNDSELANPVRLSDLDLPQDGKWLKLTVLVTTYKPRSVIYLAITSSPVVISEAVVDRSGNAVLTGLFPAEIGGNGLHRIRVVGTRQFDDVVVDKKGEISLSKSIISEIVRFDMQSSATIRSTGANLSGGNNTAVRVVPLRAPLPWWTLWICGLIAFLGLILKLSRKLHLIRQLTVGSVVLVVSGLPAQYYGWTEIAYPVMYWGAGITLLGIVLLWIAPPFRLRENRQVPDAASVQ